MSDPPKGRISIPAPVTINEAFGTVNPVKARLAVSEYLYPTLKLVETAEEEPSEAVDLPALEARADPNRRAPLILTVKKSAEKPPKAILNYAMSSETVRRMMTEIREYLRVHSGEKGHSAIRIWSILRAKAEANDWPKTLQKIHEETPFVNGVPDMPGDFHTVARWFRTEASAMRRTRPKPEGTKRICTQIPDDGFQYPSCPRAFLVLAWFIEEVATTGWAGFPYEVQLFCKGRRMNIEEILPKKGSVAEAELKPAEKVEKVRPPKYSGPLAPDLSAAPDLRATGIPWLLQELASKVIDQVDADLVDWPDLIDLAKAAIEKLQAEKLYVPMNLEERLAAAKKAGFVGLAAVEWVNKQPGPKVTAAECFDLIFR